MRYLVTIVAYLLLNQAQAQIIKDESYLDSGFVIFKNQLTTCVVNKDTACLKKLLAETVFESNDGCGFCTRNQFLKSISNTDEWEEMKNIVRYGFFRIKDEDLKLTKLNYPIVFQGPSYLKNINQYNELVILGKDINVREKPGLKSKIIAKASFEKFGCYCGIDAATETSFQDKDGIWWIEVKLKNGKSGYVAHKYTSDNFVRKMTVAKVNGQWKIISFSYINATWY